MLKNIFDDYTINTCPKCSFPLLKDGTCLRCVHGKDIIDNMSEIRNNISAIDCKIMQSMKKADLFGYLEDAGKSIIKNIGSNDIIDNMSEIRNNISAIDCKIMQSMKKADLFGNLADTGKSILKNVVLQFNR